MLESSGHIVSKLNKELDNERDKEKQWEEKSEKIKKQSENQLSQKVEEVHKANKKITTYENILIEANNKVKKFNQDN